MLPPMLLLLLAGCGAPPTPEPARPTLVLAVPQEGPLVAFAASAERGVRFAVGDALNLRVVDDGDPQALARLAEDPGVVAVIAHLDAERARAAGPTWLATGMPVIQLAPGDLPALPRALPSPAALGRCSAPLLVSPPPSPAAAPPEPPGPLVVRSGTLPGDLATAAALVAGLPPGTPMQVVDEAALALEADRLRAAAPSRVVWIGRPEIGAQFLRLFRARGGTAPFAAVDPYDAGWLEEAGALAAGSTLVSPHRPVRDPAFNARWGLAYPEPADAIAVDAHEAATLLVEAWRVARERGSPTRAGLAAALPGVSTTGASGPLALDPSGDLSPLACSLFRFDGEHLVAEITWFADTAAATPVEPPPPPPPRKRRKAPEGEWLRLAKPAPPAP